MDLSQASQAVVQLQRKSDNLERDLSRVLALLAESELNLTWVRQEMAREEREAALVTRQMADDVRTLDGTIEVARRDEVSMKQQVESQRNRADEERRTFQRTLDAVSPPRRSSPPRAARSR